MLLKRLKNIQIVISKYFLHDCKSLCIYVFLFLYVVIHKNNNVFHSHYYSCYAYMEAALANWQNRPSHTYSQTRNCGETHIYIITANVRSCLSRRGHHVRFSYLHTYLIAIYVLYLRITCKLHL